MPTKYIYISISLSTEVYKLDSDITDAPGDSSLISKPVSSDQGLEEAQTRSSQQEEVTPSISEHIGSNTILLNVIMITYFIAPQQQSQELSELEKDITNKQDDVKDNSYYLFY